MVEEKKDEKLKLEVLFDSPRWGKVASEILIVDGGAVARFSDVRLAREMYKAELALGNKNQKFIDRLSSISEKYPGKTKAEIAKEIVTKLKEHNVYVKQKDGI